MHSPLVCQRIHRFPKPRAADIQRRLKPQHRNQFLFRPLPRRERRWCNRGIEKLTPGGQHIGKASCEPRISMVFLISMVILARSRIGDLFPIRESKLSKWVINVPVLGAGAGGPRTNFIYHGTCCGLVQVQIGRRLVTEPLGPFRSFRDDVSFRTSPACKLIRRLHSAKRELET